MYLYFESMLKSVIQSTVINQQSTCIHKKLWKVRLNKSLEKDIGCAQYGDKATLVSRILDSDALETIAPPEDTSLDVADKDYGKMKKEELIFLLKKKKDNSSCMKEAMWVDTIFKPWENNTE